MAFKETEMIQASFHKEVVFKIPEIKAQWEEADKFIEENFDGRVWYGLRGSSPQGIIAAVAAVKKMPELIGSEKQIAYAKSLRLQKLADIASQFASSERLPELLAEMGKETSSKAWIESDAMEMAEKAVEALPEEAPAEQPAEKPSAGIQPIETPVISGSPKQVAWAEKIIEAKAEYLRKAGVPAEEWEVARDEITRAGGSRAWIDLREKNPRSVMLVGKHIREFVPLTGSEKQIAYAASQRIIEMAEMADVLRKYAQKDEQYIEAAIQEASKITDAKTWIELSGQDIIGEVEAAVEKKLNFRDAPAEEPSVGAAPELPTAVDLAQLPPEKAAEKIITATTEEIMAAIEAAVDATLGGRWGEPSPAQQAIRSQVIADYRALLEKGGSYVADSRGRSVFLPWLRDAEKEMANQLANIIDKARSIDEVEEGIRALVNRTDQWAETVARTETLSVANEANRRMYAAEGVEKVQIIAGKDERTCPICKQHHMRVYPIDKAPHLPLHPNCRCVYVPYISEGS